MEVTDPMFAIAIAAELAGMHPQTLRQYDRLELVVPQRTLGQSRRYSMRDVMQLREIAQLGAEGVSLEGIRRILQLENQLSLLTERVAELEHALANEMLARPGNRVFAGGGSGEVVSLRAGTRTKRNTQLMLWRPRDGTESKPAEQF